MSKVFVVAEHRNGKLKSPTFELLHASSSTGNETHAVLLGKDVSGLAAELGHYGASKVHVLEHDALENYTAEAYANAISSLAKAENPEVILASHSPTGRDFMPHLSARLEAGLASDCTFLDLSGGVKAKRPVYAGKAICEVEFIGGGPKLLTVRPNTFPVPPADSSKSAEVANAAPDLGELKSKLLELTQGSSTRPDVTEAPIVVSGGRSLKSAENFNIIEELADTLGAAVGASRAAVDAGYRPHRDQVGQTGKVVSPALYIACGISGAIQHLAGMRTSKTIVAINTDPEAPIFQLADYGIVADLFEMVPLLTKEFKALRQ